LVTSEKDIPSNDQKDIRPDNADISRVAADFEVAISAMREQAEAAKRRGDPAEAKAEAATAQVDPTSPHSADNNKALSTREGRFPSFTVEAQRHDPRSRRVDQTQPFILCNSVVGLGGVFLARQTLAPGILLYSVGALAGAVIGTAISIRWMSERAIRYYTRGICRLSRCAILAFVRSG
jgi:hypothetical protein